MIALMSPYGDRFFCQEVRELIPGTMEAKWFGYASFQPLPQIYPATSDKLKAFGVAVRQAWQPMGMNRKAFHRRKSTIRP
jgi:hypothetical protein